MNLTRIVAPAAGGGSVAPAITARIGTIGRESARSFRPNPLRGAVLSGNHDLPFDSRPQGRRHEEIGREFQFHRSAVGGAAILLRLLARGRRLPRPPTLTASDRPPSYLPGASASRIAAPSSGLMTRIANRFARRASSVERLA